MDILSITPKETSPFEKIGISDHPVLLRILMETFREDYGKDTSQVHPLHRAVHLGIREAVQSLIRFGADPKEKNSLGEIPLHVAVRMNRVNIVGILLSISNINETNYYGLTPLHWACLFGYTPIVELLLLNGASPYIHASEVDNLTPKDIAVLMDYKEIVSLIEKLNPIS
ncbi:MAG TPA: ankyrin repeat domain-containing protein [Candidatus Hydrogenedens sp.]|nr:ankyrin repeat domain-containing protein [Candidatus Hydrogenedens sp.]